MSCVTPPLFLSSGNLCLRSFWFCFAFVGEIAIKEEHILCFYFVLSFPPCSEPPPPSCSSPSHVLKGMVGGWLSILLLFSLSLPSTYQLIQHRSAFGLNARKSLILDTCGSRSWLPSSAYLQISQCGGQALKVGEWPGRMEAGGIPGLKRQCWMGLPLPRILNLASHRAVTATPAFLLQYFLQPQEIG